MDPATRCSESQYTVADKHKVGHPRPAVEGLDASWAFRNADMKLGGFDSSTGLLVSILVPFADVAASPDVGPSFSFPFSLSLESVLGVGIAENDENAPPKSEGLAGAGAVASRNRVSTKVPIRKYTGRTNKKQVLTLLWGRRLWPRLLVPEFC